MSQTPVFDRELIQRYDVSGPRYTSYPTAVQFHEGFEVADYQRHAANAKASRGPISLYVHLPFCSSLCYYCGCTKKITRHRSHGERYLDALFREIGMQGELFGRRREVRQLHFGGGTPTFFDDQQLADLMRCLSTHFRMAEGEGREFSIEIDPRTVDHYRLESLKSLGFNRVSLGVQDFDPDVQRAVNRIQDAEGTLDLIESARRLGFESLSVDLIYGLPLQTPASFEKTLDTIIGARPDRIAVYNYAHLPLLFKAQRMIPAELIPSPETKLALMQHTIEHLCEAGYVYIGMDHFALPGDELARALMSGGLQRNFQGYSTHGGLDLVGLGVSAIGKIGNCYAQNLKTIPQYTAAIDAGSLPVWRGLELSDEDRLRAAVIESIMCRGEIVFTDIERRFGIDFIDHFGVELEVTRQQASDGLLKANETSFSVTPPGRLLLRNIAMTYDEYMQKSREQAQYSRTV